MFLKNLKRDKTAGLTIIELLVAIVIFALFLAVILPLSAKREQAQRLIQKEFDRRQTVLTYGLANGNQVIKLEEGWYYFREPQQGSDIGRTISSFLSENMNVNGLVLSIVCPANNGNDVLEKISTNDKLLTVLSANAGLTNGYFVQFRTRTNNPLKAETDVSHR